MRTNTRTLSRALDTVWYVSMGLFLGLTAGLVLAVILTFRGARAIDATPGVEPFSDPRFAEYHNDAVAGYIGQSLFMVGGTAAVVLLGVALVTYEGRNFVLRKQVVIENKICRWLQATGLTFCVLLMGLCAVLTYKMNADWPPLYESTASQGEREDRRERFEEMHRHSEKLASTAWLCGLIALAVSPWCRRIADNAQTKDQSLSKQ